ncbi:MAG: NAD(+) synthase [Hyphomonadaceae bacterium]
MAFDNLYNHGFVRVATAAPLLSVADPERNIDEAIALLKRAHDEACALLIFPELGVSAYAIDDLLLQAPLLAAVDRAVARIATASQNLSPLFAVGAPIRVGGAVYNAAIIIQRGRVLGVAPKTYLPNYREFYEKRYFASGPDAIETTVRVAGQEAPFGVDLLFCARDAGDFIAHFEICEDVWSAIPPSTYAAFAGATVLCNLSASNITIGKAEDRNLLCAAQSHRCCAAYLYSAAGAGDSTTDLAWDGHLAIFELGAKIAESPRFQDQSAFLTADVDVERLVQERARFPTFRDCAHRHTERVRDWRRISFELGAARDKALPLLRPVSRFPYVPDDPARLDQDCYEAYNIQVQGLAKRVASARVQKVVIGVSGGLDSTQALLVAARAFDRIGRPRSDIIGVTMPGFATSEGTKSNAWRLMQGLGVDARELDIRPAAKQMLADIGHPYADGEKVYDITFENVQAGLRTDYLFRIANHNNGLVVGTGDLSELALGWCTYGVGDHMSHYNVNASVSKTLIQHLIRWSAETKQYSDDVAKILRAILATEISPELVPADAHGAIQSTQDKIGPYALHDFFLYYTTRFGLGPAKIAFLAQRAWSDAARGAWPAHLGEAEKRAYALPEILHWLGEFLHRFFATSQFKRTCVPNGPKISSGGSLSPRGDWRAPSDSSAAPWLAELEALKQQLATAKKLR